MATGQSYPAQFHGANSAEAALIADTSLAVQLLAFAATHTVSLAQIALPVLPDPPLATEPDRAILRAVAPLYFAMEVESTGLTRALSVLAGLYATGALRLDQTPVAALLMEHHRGYEMRHPSDDRYAAYLRLFGTAPEGAVPYATDNAVNTGFEEAMLRLAEAMHRYAHMSPLELSPNVAQREIRTAARLLGETLVMRGGGASAYLADEALELIQRATKTFSDDQVQAALGSRDMWDAVASAMSLGQGQPRRRFPDQGWTMLTRARLSRGRAGMVLLDWLAEEAPRLSGLGQLPIPREAPILAEGTVWLETTLSLLSAQEEQDNAA